MQIPLVTQPQSKTHPARSSPHGKVHQPFSVSRTQVCFGLSPPGARSLYTAASPPPPYTNSTATVATRYIHTTTHNRLGLTSLSRTPPPPPPPPHRYRYRRARARDPCFVNFARKVHWPRYDFYLFDIYIYIVIHTCNIVLTRGDYLLNFLFCLHESHNTSDRYEYSHEILTTNTRDTYNICYNARG